VIGTGSALWVETERLDESPLVEADVEDLTIEYRAAAATLLQKIGGRRMAGALNEIEDPGVLADSIGYWPELSLERRLELLETAAVDERLRKAIGWVKETLAEVETRERIQKEVTDDLEQGQREAILRRQMAAIKSELDGDDGDAIGDYRARLEATELPEKTADAVAKEIDRLERTGNDSMEANWIRTWLDTVFDLPWGNHDQERLELDSARSILDADHTGLDDVKDRLIEHLAVKKLRADRGIVDEEGRRKGVIMALVGPPGVGKTSLGESIARALDRKFVRLALGGVRDEAEIRGHRRTYVGARPGRLVRALTEAGSMNPVVLLDEVDKVGNAAYGDPSSALLEVLDPAQNHSFRDHYLEFELDLSDVVFIATANVLDTIPGPLLDRMEVIPIEGYTEREKATIAVDHLLPRLIAGNGLNDGEVIVPEDVIRQIASDYTREAGVRRLERLLDKILRKKVTEIAGEAETPITIDRDELANLLGRPVPREEIVDRIDRPGIATGLAVTGAGGDVLFVETALIPGEGEPLLTGQLGDVMKESASLARSVIGAIGPDLGIAIPTGQRLHVHFPAGAVPKDGPSAGITMTTALASLLSGRRVRSDVAMTGEITLQGRVLPIGGVKAKILAAHQAGITTVLLPKANGPDLEDVPDDVLERVTVHLVSEISEVLERALEPVDKQF
jgi:ATP-dependent Lon protease